MEITPPSLARQQMADIERQREQTTAVTTRTTNAMDEELVVTTFTPYEQQIYTSRTD